MKLSLFPLWMVMMTVMITLLEQVIQHRQLEYTMTMGTWISIVTCLFFVCLSGGLASGETPPPPPDEVQLGLIGSQIQCQLNIY